MGFDLYLCLLLEAGILAGELREEVHTINGLSDVVLRSTYHSVFNVLKYCVFRML